MCHPKMLIVSQDGESESSVQVVVPVADALEQYLVVFMFVLALDYGGIQYCNKCCLCCFSRVAFFSSEADAGPDQR